MLSKNSLHILRLAINSPLRRNFDYLPPRDFAVKDLKKLVAGVRVRVPFGKREAIGIFLEYRRQTDIDAAKLKHADAILDTEPLLPVSMLELCRWASNYYHHSLGEVIFTALPKLLRDGAALPAVSLDKDTPSAKPNISAAANFLNLNAAQEKAVAAILAAQNKNSIFLLDGVTGSGKTEVYLRVIDAVVQAGQQALVLVPEISLTPQILERFQERFPGRNIVIFHSRLTDKARLTAWLEARQGTADIVIGTRSALFTPLARPGVIILDEEHDLSFKQQSGWRYSARDLAVVRSKLENVPLILGSATPSFASIHNAAVGRYVHLTLPERVGTAVHPAFKLVDIRKQRLKHGLASQVITAIEEHLAADGQVLLFINRRGYAPSLLCHYCGWVATCSQCDARLTMHKQHKHLSCHHCGRTEAITASCPKCGSSELTACGIGSERLEAGLNKIFPAVAVVRVDSDTTRRKGSLQTMLQEVQSGSCKILLGTQMLTKGHHFPNVTMVVIVNADGGLASVDFRASEYLAQLIVQVAGRAGRALKPGVVYVQTHHPDHALLLSLIHAGYNGFVKTAMLERKQAELPPFSYMALIRASGKKAAPAEQFLQALRVYGAKLALSNVHIMGPVASVIERKAGSYHYQLLLQSSDRQVLHCMLNALIVDCAERLPIAKRVKWSIDVDPVDVVG